MKILLMKEQATNGTSLSILDLFCSMDGAPTLSHTSAVFDPFQAVQKNYRRVKFKYMHSLGRKHQHKKEATTIVREAYEIQYSLSLVTWPTTSYKTWALEMLLELSSSRIDSNSEQCKG